jgi:4-amino-4-deoxy-L-arabinose transferase-like glycosyltransferase
MLLAVVAAAFISLATTEAWRDGPTYDEPVYVASGLAAIVDHDVTVNPEHPPLAKALAAIPVLAVGPAMPDMRLTADEASFSADFVEAQNRAGDLHEVMFAARLVPILETAAVGFVLFGIGRRLYSRRVGLLAGSLWLATPLVMGIGHLDSMDVASALAVSLWALAVVAWVQNPSLIRAGLVGVACAAAAMGDMDGLVLAPLAAAALAFLAEPPRLERVRSLVTAGLCAWLTIWATYLLFQPDLILSPGLLPQPYLDGISVLLTKNHRPQPGYLLGRTWVGMQWWYLPVDTAIKSPPATLLLLLSTPLAGLRRLRGSALALMVLVIPAVVMAVGPEMSTHDIGDRYVLPSLALALVASSSVVFAFLGRWATAVAGATAVSSAALALISFPASLSAVTPGLGPAYTLVSNSDVDWGQSWYALQSWARGRQPLVEYFGPRGLAVNDIPGARPLPAPPSSITGWVAVSASDLELDARDRWLWAYCPVQVLDASVLIYRFDAAPAPDLPEPARPSRPCGAADRYSRAGS